MAVRRYNILRLAAVVLALACSFAMFADEGNSSLISRYAHSILWKDKIGVISSVYEMCEPYYYKPKKGKSFTEFGVMTCAEAERLMASAPEKDWGNPRFLFGIATNLAGDTPFQGSFRLLEFDSKPSLGDRVSLLVDPSGSGNVDRPISTFDKNRIHSWLTVALFVFPIFMIPLLLLVGKMKKYRALQ